MNKLLIILSIFIASTFYLNAQNYNTGIGLRLGYYHNGGLTVKHFVSRSNAVEGILTSYWHNGFQVSGLFEHHMNFFDESRLKWFIGVGGSVGIDSGTGIGALGVIGLEYKFRTAPLTLGLDWMPYIPVINGNGFAIKGGGLSIRYTF